MHIINQAYAGIFSKDCPYEFSLKYSGKFKGFNANVIKKGNYIEFRLSRNWEPVSNDIKMGLIQELMVKLFKRNINTYHMDLYNIFLKKIHIAIPKTLNDPILNSSFQKVNDQYFLGFIEKPNLVWGNHSLSKIGSYDYGTDTISISQALKDAPQEILDYVMYHEMLHKAHKFTSKAGRSRHHTKKFRTAESAFKNQEQIEKQLDIHLAKKRKPRFWLFK